MHFIVLHIGATSPAHREIDRYAGIQ